MKGPKIQRLITPERLARKEKKKSLRAARAIKRKTLKKDYEQKLKDYKEKLKTQKPAEVKKEEPKKEEKKN
eukprot:EC821223.1.p2 GENE.EC821223.1~~EC821223.1.p2  ORF type:complete len:71 (+),score=49.57 EC821223.1:291-503(+)